MLCWWWNKIIVVGTTMSMVSSTGKLVSFLTSRGAPFREDLLGRELFRQHHLSSTSIYSQSGVQYLLFPQVPFPIQYFLVLWHPVVWLCPRQGRNLDFTHLIRKCLQKWAELSHCGSCVAEPSASTNALCTRAGQQATSWCWELVL